MSDENENLEQPIDLEESIESLKEEEQEALELAGSLDMPEAELPVDTSDAESNQWLNQPLLTAATLDWEKTIWAAILILTIVTRFWGLGDRVVSHDESLHTQYSYLLSQVLPE